MSGCGVGEGEFAPRAKKPPIPVIFLKVGLCLLSLGQSHSEGDWYKNTCELETWDEAGSLEQVVSLEQKPPEGSGCASPM
jgi:hypothetical protein